MKNHSIVMETFKTAEEYINKVKEALLEMIWYLQAGKENMALGMLKGFLEGVEWLIEVKRLSESIDERYRIDIDMECFCSVLEQVAGAQENQDYVLMADCLEYEIMPLLERYGSELSRIQGEFH